MKPFLYNLFIFFLFSALLLPACTRKQPSAAERRAEKRIQDSISLIEQQRTLSYYDSLAQVLPQHIDSLLPLFSYQKEEQYESKGKYTHRTFNTPSNLRRNYIRAYIYDDAQLEMQCVYYGKSPISITHIILTADSVSLSFRGSAHTFSIDGENYEMLTLNKEDASQCLHFIDAYSAGRIRVALCGARSKTIFYLSEVDKQALITTYRLGTLMQDAKELDTRIRQTSMQIQKYRRRLSK